MEEKKEDPLIVLISPMCTVGAEEGDGEEKNQRREYCLVCKDRAEWDGLQLRSSRFTVSGCAKAVIVSV